ncbi:hypothetical protein DFH07DRAFT_926664 [Mycena maculata]|uniref:BTB domain-containing protein n=1 Tax=Mycena maculata TaxID=230809 RepID=A0AAD7N0H8_9AGAR|nr:hypothetical protein DFH07DRAFT_926664 [Mycena maculata]
MDLSDTSTDGPAETAPIRDEKYFFDDGDCMFLVGGVLFKLHRLFLCRDPESMFRGMFSIPQNGMAQAPDLEPIPLPDDTADEFRAFCWAIYALPGEIYLQSTHKGDIARLVNVAKMGHKYTLPMFESWALEMLVTQGPIYLRTCAPNMLSRIMSLAALCENGQLFALVETFWLSRVRGGLPCTEALSAGEMHGRRRFLADVYYHLHKELCTTALSPASAFSHLHLTDKQLLRLLSGHTLLTNFWDHLRQGTPPQLAQCYNHSYCNSLG